jgi:beta-ribofuranosylaminobenzene 5'-phosphate synthase
MIRVETAGRLHFGLFNPVGITSLDHPTLRRFGGVGLMVEQPRLVVEVEPAGAWSAVGPLADRALAAAQRFAAGVTADRLAPVISAQLRILAAPPAHVGLGTGTQLALAVARGLAALWGLDLAPAELARRTGRGRRSALGVYGFEQGGLLIEGGKRGEEPLAPLLLRRPFPEDWRLLLVRPPAEPGLHGDSEKQAFDTLPAAPGDAGRVDVLCRLVLLGMLPALVTGDREGFGEALYEFNRKVGEAFAPAQGGAYAGPRVAALVDWLRGQGVRGVGQTSWGPTVFALIGPEDDSLPSRLTTTFPDAEALVTRACNHPARVLTDETPGRGNP